MGLKERFTSKPMLKKMILATANGKVLEISYECYEIIDKILGEFLEAITKKAVENLVKTKGKRLDRRDFEAAMGMEIVDMPNRKCLQKKNRVKIKPLEKAEEPKEEAELEQEDEDVVIKQEPMASLQTTEVPVQMPEPTTIPEGGN
ncbi:hypothetical protein M0R04_11120 [Candidatus Dojkabacteria bacterium]|jgi:histone H3/H4|nr:hypothetical protein [Candidatus Dojkabacteria bacterium]